MKIFYKISIAIMIALEIILLCSSFYIIVFLNLKELYGINILEELLIDLVIVLAEIVIVKYFTTPFKRELTLKLRKEQRKSYLLK